MQRLHGWLSSCGSRSATNSRPLDLGTGDAGGKPAMVYPSGHSPDGSSEPVLKRENFTIQDFCWLV